EASRAMEQLFLRVLSTCRLRSRAAAMMDMEARLDGSSSVTDRAVLGKEWYRSFGRRRGRNSMMGVSSLWEALQATNPLDDMSLHLKKRLAVYVSLTQFYGYWGWQSREVVEEFVADLFDLKPSSVHRWCHDFETSQHDFGALWVPESGGRTQRPDPAHPLLGA
ncbi:hypothetical protein FOZ63_008039, partial [Perkinsus olseni]